MGFGIFEALYDLTYGVICCGFCTAEQTLQATGETVVNAQQRATSNIPSSRKM